MTKKIIICTCLLITMATLGRAQVSRNAGQFVFAPYLYNPAFSGMNGEKELNILYKRSMMGFDDAPTGAYVNLQLPTSRKVILSFNVSSRNEALLRNTSINASFGYVVPISAKESLRFGLAGGVGLQKLDLTADELNTSDQAILSAAPTNYYVDGKFGFVYTNSGLKLGISLPDLFQSNPFKDGFNEVSVSNFKTRIYSLSYRFKLDPLGNFSAEPYAVFHQRSGSKENVWETATVFHYQDLVWTGASYHQANGMSVLLGFDLLEKFRFSYGYQFPVSNSATFQAHELQLTLRFGQRAEGSQKVTAANTFAEE